MTKKQLMAFCKEQKLCRPGTGSVDDNRRKVRQALHIVNSDPDARLMSFHGDTGTLLSKKQKELELPDCVGEYKWTFNLQGASSFTLLFSFPSLPCSLPDRFDRFLSQYEKFSNPFVHKDGRLAQIVIGIGLVQTWMLMTESKIRADFTSRKQYQMALLDNLRPRRSSTAERVKPPSQYYLQSDFLDEAFKYYTSHSFSHLENGLARQHNYRSHT